MLGFASLYPTYKSLVVPVLTTYSSATLHAPALPAWGKAKIATSHLFRDAPRDDGYY